MLDLVRLPNSIELNPRIEFDWVRLSYISERSIDFAGLPLLCRVTTTYFTYVCLGGWNTRWPREIVSARRKYDHVSPALKELRWLPVKEHLYYRDAVMSFKCLTGCAPEYLSTQFIRRGDVTNRRTRSSQMLNIPRFRTASGQRSFCYRAVTLWNSLSNDLKLCESVNVFKRRLRSRLLSNLSTSAI